MVNGRGFSSLAVVKTIAKKILTWDAKQVLLAAGGGTLKIGRKVRPILLGPKTLSRPIFLDLVFCLLKFIFLGSQLAENLCFWINLVHNKSELNEKILNGRLSRPCSQ